MAASGRRPGPRRDIDLNTLGICREHGWATSTRPSSWSRESCQIAEEVGSPEDLNRAYMGNLGSLLVASGRLEESCRRWRSTAPTIGEELWGVRLGRPPPTASEALIRLGRHAEAEALLGTPGSADSGAAPSGETVAARAMLAVRPGASMKRRGAVLRCSRRFRRRLADVEQRGACHMLCAEMALLQDRPGEAYADIEQALTLAARIDDEELSRRDVRAGRPGRGGPGGPRGPSSTGGSSQRRQGPAAGARADQQEAEPAGGRAPVRARERPVPRLGASLEPAMCAAERVPVARTGRRSHGPRQPGSGRPLREPYPVGLLPLAGGGGAAPGAARAERERVRAACLQQAWESAVELRRWSRCKSGSSDWRSGHGSPLARSVRRQAGGTGVALDLGLTPRESEVLGAAGGMVRT